MRETIKEKEDRETAVRVYEQMKERLCQLHEKPDSGVDSWKDKFFVEAKVLKEILFFTVVGKYSIQKIRKLANTGFTEEELTVKKTGLMWNPCNLKGKPKVLTITNKNNYFPTFTAVEIETT